MRISSALVAVCLLIPLLVCPVQSKATVNESGLLRKNDAPSDKAAQLVINMGGKEDKVQDPVQESGSMQKEVLALPSVAPGTTFVEVNGNSVSLRDKLGPLVVQEDGSLQRITNWEDMTDEEKARTIRVLTKRNKLRLNALKGQNLAADRAQQADGSEEDISGSAVPPQPSPVPREEL